ncbi:tRNA (guanosine(37)-N1)-methyltransferase TrmD [Amnimonas aquatica]|uniref:tRNA (guanine-N(1)-)-methyltransferase n=1 Tax=Amnimonas aquatica TaxID=2094561 RepID=A0A2P6AVF6_9GAMM|nr:tRNA (guanosine(37)-N1)-methyltransferase TrmD [Amnimonas aquatica]PQA52216.1 tRNA (guanosine(37)-N1)-methyltransferase TrmD [Amnimonas aquatica]
MWVGLVTLFPDMFRAISESGVTARAVATGRLVLESWNPRDFTEDNYRRVDDRPYGGGPGMVMLIEPLRRAIAAARAAAAAKGVEAPVIYLSPQGRRLDQPGVRELVASHGEQGVILLCGRYEGIDERLIQREVDAEWSIGDYVLSGGELPAMVLIDAMARLLPGVLNTVASADEDSFTDGLLDCPHYTRPEVYEGDPVPAVLLSGDHAAIRRWRLQQSLLRTRARRPDLLAGRELSKEERTLLDRADKA